MLTVSYRRAIVPHPPRAYGLNGKLLCNAWHFADSDKGENHEDQPIGENA